MEPTSDLPARRIRAGDPERDQVLEVLQSAHVAGRLDVEALNQRQEVALQAVYVDELERLVDDLPEGHVPQATRRTPPAVSGANPSFQLTLMSGKSIRPPKGTTGWTGFAMWGGDDIDLTDAMGPGVTVTLNLNAVMAGHDIFVPPGVRVVDKSIAIMAGNDVHAGAQGDGSQGTLVLKGFLFWAGNDVKLAPGFMTGNR